jgi:hypothetical protein
MQASSTQPYPTAGPSTMPNRMGKSPIVVAILNLFFGLGYWYLGCKKVLGISTIWFVVATFTVFSLLSLFISALVSLILAVILAVDGYQKGQGRKGFITVQ